jgi:hypothetical protein
MIPDLEYKRWELKRTEQQTQKDRAEKALLEIWDVGRAFMGPFRSNQCDIEATEPFTNNWAVIAHVSNFTVRHKIVELLNEWWKLENDRRKPCQPDISCNPRKVSGI